MKRCGENVRETALQPGENRANLRGLHMAIKISGMPLLFKTQSIKHVYVKWYCSYLNIIKNVLLT